MNTIILEDVEDPANLEEELTKYRVVQENLLKRKQNEFVNVKRNDRCPCLSGRKFKVCCGRNR